MLVPVSQFYVYLIPCLVVLLVKSSKTFFSSSSKHNSGLSSYNMLICISNIQMEPRQEAERPASPPLPLLSSGHQQAAKRTHHGADTAAVLRQEVRPPPAPAPPPGAGHYLFSCINASHVTILLKGNFIFNSIENKSTFRYLEF